MSHLSRGEKGIVYLDKACELPGNPQAHFLQEAILDYTQICLGFPPPSTCGHLSPCISAYPLGTRAMAGLVNGVPWKSNSLF